MSCPNTRKSIWYLLFPTNVKSDIQYGETTAVYMSQYQLKGFKINLPNKYFCP